MTVKLDFVFRNNGIMASLMLTPVVSAIVVARFLVCGLVILLSHVVRGE